MELINQPVVLMLLPAILVLAGILIGYVSWAWIRGIDNQMVEDLQDDIRRLGNRIKNQPEASINQDLKLENDELFQQCGSLRECLDAKEHELREVNSLLRVAESENLLALQTIRKLREQQPERDAASVDLTTGQPTYKFVNRPIFRPELALDNEQESEATIPAELMILQPDFGPNDSAQPHHSCPNQEPILDSEYGGEVGYDEMLGRVYTLPPIINDNLKLISGIASKLEQQLNDFGVFTFQQIMLWDANNITQFSQLLDTFQDRIGRDDWVGQAAKLYEKSRSIRSAA